MEWILYIWVPLFYTPQRTGGEVFAWKAEGIYVYDIACKNAARNLNIPEGKFRCISNRNGEIAK